MRFEFNQGVPNDCITWLWLNVGVGNITYNQEEPGIRREKEKQIGDAWYYERVRTTDTDTIYFVPTITVKDEKMATMFALRWL